jgi:hypothetical protein
MGRLGMKLIVVGWTGPLSGQHTNGTLRRHYSTALLEFPENDD